jgi:T5SS/PEP-CTERM-associated repeat protein
VSVVGTNSTWGVTDALGVGYLAQGSLSIAGGGSVTVQGGAGTLEAGTPIGGGVLCVGTNGNFVLADGSGGSSGPILPTGSTEPTIQFVDSTGVLTVNDPAVLPAGTRRSRSERRTGRASFRYLRRAWPEGRRGISPPDRRHRGRGSSRGPRAANQFP